MPSVSVAARVPAELASFIDSQIDEKYTSTKDRCAVVKSMLYAQALQEGWRPKEGE